MKDNFLMACFAVLCAMTGWAGHWSYSVVERESIRREIREDASATDAWAKDCDRWFTEANRDLKLFGDRVESLQKQLNDLDREKSAEITQLQNVVSAKTFNEPNEPESCK